MTQSKIIITMFLTKRNISTFDLYQIHTDKKNKWKWMRTGKKRF